MKQQLVWVLRWRDGLKRHHTSCNIRSHSWERLARQRPKWRSSIKRLSYSSIYRLENLYTKRLDKKNRPSYPYTYNGSGTVVLSATLHDLQDEIWFRQPLSITRPNLARSRRHVKEDHIIYIVSLVLVLSQSSGCCWISQLLLENFFPFPICVHYFLFQYNLPSIP